TSASFPWRFPAQTLNHALDRQERTRARMDRIVPRDSASQAAATDENLPSWDLSDLYPAPDAPEVEADLQAAERAAKAFAAARAGTLAAASGAALAAAIGEYERIDEILGRLVT